MSLLLNFGYLLSILVMLPWVIHRVIVRGDWRSILSRLGFSLPPPSIGAIWLHGSSVGEVSLLRSLVNRLEKDFPDVPLIISAYSATGYAAAKKTYPEHRVLFFPLDLSFIVRRFLNRFNPRLVIIIESDLWPNFLLAAKSRRVQLVVLNGKLSERSYRFHSMTRLIPMLLQHVSVIAVQNQQYGSRFLKLGFPAEKIHVTGNMKYDLIESINEIESSNKLRESLGYSKEDRIIIGGSLHDKENDVLIETFQDLSSEHNNISLIIVPRYPTDVEQIENYLKSKDLYAVRKSELDKTKCFVMSQQDILIVDTIGELRTLYSIANIAFVGGSLFYRGKKKGGHNIIEPAVLGVPVLFGPYNFSFQDTVRELLAAEAGIQVSDQKQLNKALDELLINEHRRQRMGQRARDVILKNKGVTDRNYRLLTPLLKKIRIRPDPAQFTIWSIVVYFLLPYALLALVWRGMRYPAYWYRWPERFGYITPMQYKKTAWVHAVSVGEVRGIYELVKSLLKKYPSHRILITTATPTGSSQVQELFGDRVSHSYVPYDLPIAVQRFMDRVNPDFVVVAETEFWPNLFGECRRRKIPLLLVNVRVSPASIRGYRRVPITSNAMLENADVLCVQTKNDALELGKLGVSERLIHVTGNLKFDLPVPELLVQEGLFIRENWGKDRFVLIAASTHRGEERRVLDAFNRLKKKYPQTLLVIVPRHPERFTSVTKLSRKAGYNVVCRSTHKGKLTSNIDVLVGDTMGELQKLYVASDVAIIGGSLVPIGGHNLLEACAVGVPVIFGPHMFHLSELSAMVIERNAGYQIDGTRDLVEVVSTYIESPSVLKEAGDSARRLVSENSGSLARTLKLIDSTLQAKSENDSNNRFN